MWNQQSSYQQPCEQSNLLFTSGSGSSRLSTQKSEDWTTGWDSWGQENHSTEEISKNKKVTSKSKSSSKGNKKDEQKSQLIDFDNDGGDKSKKSALTDAWDNNDGWETLNKDD